MRIEHDDWTVISYRDFLTDIGQYIYQYCKNNKTFIKYLTINAVGIFKNGFKETICLNIIKFLINNYF